MNRRLVHQLPPRAAAPALPALLIYLALLVIPMLGMAWSSLFLYDRSTGLASGSPSLANFSDYLGDPRNIEIILRTLRISFITTLSSLAIGYPAAFFISQCSRRAQSYLILAIAMPLMVLVVVRTFGWMVVLDSRGLINNVLQDLGIVDHPLRLLRTEPAIVIGLVHVNLAYMVLSVLNSLQSIEPTLARAARILGATPRRTLIRVTIPLSLPGVVAGCLLVFTLSMSAFATPAMLGGSAAPMMSYSVYQEVFFLTNWPLASAISLILCTVTSVFVLTYLTVIQNRRYRMVFG